MAKKWFVLNAEQFDKFVTKNPNGESLIEYADTYFLKTVPIDVRNSSYKYNQIDKVISIDDSFTGFSSYRDTIILVKGDDRLKLKIYDTYSLACSRYYENLETKRYFVLSEEEENIYVDKRANDILVVHYNDGKIALDQIVNKVEHWHDKNIYSIDVKESVKSINLYSRPSSVNAQYLHISLYNNLNDAHWSIIVQPSCQYKGDFAYSNQVEHEDTNDFMPYTLSSIKLDNSGYGPVYFHNKKYDSKVHEKIFDSMLDRTSYAAKVLDMLLDKKETNMTIKNVKFNGRATIVFWDNAPKTVVKCFGDEKFDAEKGLAMAICKGILKSNCFWSTKYSNWKNYFMLIIPDNRRKRKSFKKPMGDEKALALQFVREHYYNNAEDWYKQFTSYLPKEEPKKEPKKEEVIVTVKELPIDCKALHANIPESTTAKVISETNDTSISDSPLVDKINQDYILEMFNAGASIRKISVETGLSEYYVKKYIDIATNPDYGKNKAARILNNIAKKKNKPEKKERKKHVIRTQIDYPDYLDKETCDMVLERTKEKYKDHDKIQYLSELQKYFIMECKREYIMTHYGNGYDMYAIAKVIGINAASVQRIWNACKSGKES